MNEMTRDRVFISYAHEDLDTIRKVVDGLKNRKLNVWFDKEDLGPGRWKPQIVKVINRSRYFVICISQAALRKTGEKPGFQDDELNTAYGIAQEQPDREFTIIPVRLEECGRGDFRISGFQQYDLFPELGPGLDRFSVHLGGVSLADATARDERSKDEKLIEDLLIKGMVAYYANDFEKALTINNSVLAIEPNSPEAWHNKGVALSYLGRYEEALATSDKTIKLIPNDPKVWHNKGESLGNLGRYEESLDAFERALKLNPSYFKAWYNKSMALFRLGRHEKALAACNIAIKCNPGDQGALNLKRTLIDENPNLSKDYAKLF